MNSTCRAAAVAVMVMGLLASQPLMAEDELEPGSWERVEKLDPGEKITVYMKNSNKQECLYQKMLPLIILSICNSSHSCA